MRTPVSLRKRSISATKNPLIRFAVGTSSLGSVLVAVSEKGVFAITIGTNSAVLLSEFQTSFPHAVLSARDPEIQTCICRVIDAIETPGSSIHVPLDIHGTEFQKNVWNALRTIPLGTTASYAEIAQRISKPKAMRAVAQACASNQIAVIIPCHRVIRADGSLSGYRWGAAVKAALLEREMKHCTQIA
jgi:AraC family transcriptional regulator of adaptative response/methylated-DNA-[protein]-cysteine methyltransferase